MEVCENCKAPSNIQDQTCASCGHFLGYPNVNLANLSEELSALESRWDKARKLAEEQGLQAVFDAITEFDWQLVVSIPSAIALILVTDPKNHYVNYEKLTGAGVRSPAKFADDAHRSMVAGVLFGSIGDKIIYGVLSKDRRGLSAYGSIYCQLKTNAVATRTSFLETNSYEFVKKYQTDLPKGFRAAWENRGKLAALKLFESGTLAVGQVPDDWDRLILQTDGKNRKQDEYVEGHIYGTITAHSVSEMTAAEVLKRSEETRIVESILEAFQQRK